MTKIKLSKINFEKVDELTTFSQKGYPLMKMEVWRSGEKPPEKAPKFTLTPPPLVYFSPPDTPLKAPNSKGFKNGVTPVLCGQEVGATPFDDLLGLSVQERIANLGYFRYLRSRSPQNAPLGSKERPLTLALDTEYEELSWDVIGSDGLLVEHTVNLIVSYQWSVFVDDIFYIFLIIPNNARFFRNLKRAKEHKHAITQYRLAFNTHLGHICKWLSDNKVVSFGDSFVKRSLHNEIDAYKKWKKRKKAQKVTSPDEGVADDKKEEEKPPKKPEEKPPYFYIQVATHSGKADLSTFYRKGNDPLRHTTNIQGGLVSTEHDSYQQCWLPDRNHVFYCGISYADCMGHAAVGNKTLASIGASIGVPKVDLSDISCLGDSAIKNMSSVLRDEPDIFREYAMTDTLIVLQYLGTVYGFNTRYPVTAASAAAGYFRELILNEFFEGDIELYEKGYRGLIKVQKKELVNENDKSMWRTDVRRKPMSPHADEIWRYGSLSYYGGYNQCFTVGEVVGDTFDFDLCSAYPTAMCMVPAIDFDKPVIRYDRMEITLAHVQNPTEPFFGVFNVEFPENCNLPNVPVPYDDGNGLIFPRKAEQAYLCAPDVWLALLLGAKVYSVYAFKPVLQMDKQGRKIYHFPNALKTLIEDRQAAKTLFPDTSAMEQLLKVAANSIYGKTVQGVQEKRAYNVRTKQFEEIPWSAITNAPMAAMTTAIVRSMLIGSMHQIEEMGYKVFSATTDGFISNAPKEALDTCDCYGFKQLFHAVAVDFLNRDDVWEVKHQQHSFLNLKTRGNVSLEDTGVIARCSYKGLYPKKSPLGRQEFFGLALHRTGRVSFNYQTDTSHRNLIEKDRDYLFTKQEKSISLDYDMKRMPVMESAEDKEVIYSDVCGKKKTGEHIYFDTKPHEKLEDFILWREAMKQIPKLTTRADLELVEMRKINIEKGTGKAVIVSSDPEKSIVQSIIKGWLAKNPSYDLPLFDNLKRREIIALINGLQLTKRRFNIENYKNCQKKRRQNALLAWEIVEPMYLYLYSLDEAEARAVIDEQMRKDKEAEEKKAEKEKAKAATK